MPRRGPEERPCLFCSSPACTTLLNGRSKTHAVPTSVPSYVLSLHLTAPLHPKQVHARVETPDRLLVISAD
eukprot:1142559-Pelagomonas_calceolata.AAC.2